MASIFDQLKSLGVRVGVQDLPRRESLVYPIEQVVDGQLVDTPFGQTFMVEKHYPADHRQGRAALHIACSLHTIAAWADEARLASLDPRSFIFLDTETSGLAGGTGTFAFLIGVGRIEDHGFRLAQYFLRDPLEEAAQLAALHGFLGDFKGIVSFNGKSFDVPILNARFVLNGDISPFKTAIHLDLLHLARRLWRDRLPSRKLGDLEENILYLRRTQEDVPGWLVPQLYDDYLKNGDARPLKSVFYHNAMDVVSLAALLSHIAATLDDPPQSKFDDAIDLVATGKLLEDLGDLDVAAQLYARGLDSELPEANRIEALFRWAMMEKRRENLHLAAELWREATQHKHIEAHVELAKYYEHRVRNVPEAILWTEAALALARASGFPKEKRQQWMPALEHRLARLQSKLEREGLQKEQ